MEHRLGRRIEAEVGVVVRRRCGSRLHCRTGNVSDDGLFLALDAHGNGIREGEIVEVFLNDAEIAPGRGDVVYVVHRQARGIGVMFTTTDGATRAALLQRLSAMQEPAPMWRYASR